MTDERTPLSFLVGAFVSAVGLGTFAAAVARLFAPAWESDAYLAVFGAGCGAPLVVTVVVFFMFMWRDAASRARVSEWEAQARLAKVAPTEVQPPTDTASEIDRLERKRLQEIAHWQVFYRRLWAAGMAYGWDSRTLTGTGKTTRVTSQPGWNTATDNLAAAGWLRKDQSGTIPTVTTERWERERLWEHTPCPNGEPPEIAPPPYSKQQTPRQTAVEA